MTFNSWDDLESYILSRSKDAVIIMREKVYEVIHRFLKQFYSEYTPVLYERTEQLLYSLVKTEVKQSEGGKGWVAEVYFDLSALDYHTYTLNGILYTKDNWTKYDDERVLRVAMEGEHPHGGWSTDKETAIWTESMAVFKKEKLNILKKALEDAGIPVK